MSESGNGLSVAVHRDAPPRIEVSGQADFHTRERISDAFDDLLDEGYCTICADLSNLYYMDSSGLSALIKCARRAAQAGGAIHLLGVSEQVSRVLTMCGAATFFRADIAEVPVCGEDDCVTPPDGFWQVSDFSVPAAPEAAAFTRMRIGEVISSVPMSKAEHQDVLVAVGEALANAIKHGCNCDTNRSISVKCVAGPTRLAIDVSDSGPGFDLDSISEPSPESLIEGGMGIHIMREVMDEVHFSFEDGTTVRLVKLISSPAPEKPKEPAELVEF